jgi:hypothetical protein
LGVGVQVFYGDEDENVWEYGCETVVNIVDAEDIVDVVRRRRDKWNILGIVKRRGGKRDIMGLERRKVGGGEFD